MVLSKLRCEKQAALVAARWQESGHASNSCYRYGTYLGDRLSNGISFLARPWLGQMVNRIFPVAVVAGVSNYQSPLLIAF